MAKVKISDFLKKIGIKLEDEIDIAEEQAVDVNKDKNLNNVDVVEDKTNEDIKETVVQEVKKMTPKYDKKTGLFDLTGIEDEALKAVLKESNDTVKANRSAAMINKAVSDKLGTLKLAKGISPELVSGALNRTGIKVDGDNVVGVDEAFAELQKTNAGLFITESKPASNPMLEGFNPQVVVQSTKNMSNIDYAMLAISE